MSGINNKQITHEVSISQEFYAEMARVVGSVGGDYLIFESQEQAIAYLKDSDCLIFKSNEDAKEYVNNELDCIVYDNEADMSEHLEESYGVGAIFSRDKIVEWVKQEYTIDEVFDDSDITEYACENNGVGDVFSEETIVDWVQDNIELDDIYGDEEIICAYKRTEHYEKNREAKEMTTSRESIIKARDEALKELENVKTELGELKVFYEEWKHIEETTADGDEKHYVVSARIHKANLFEREHLFFENEALKKELAEMKQALKTLLQFAS
jgi:hypothetical protein